MRILIINSGSSSIKFQLLSMADESVLAAGLVERIGEADGLLQCTTLPGTAKAHKVKIQRRIANHQEGMRAAVTLLTDPDKGVIKDLADIDAIGHRVVHGGEDVHRPTLITDELIVTIEKNNPLAPLHNPANLDGIRVARELFPGIPQVAVFDTAFHQSIPARAYLYALPYEMYERYRIRRYGFHGTSHKFVAGECAKLLGKPLEQCNMITVHLGNGCSMTAIEKGLSIDTTLGMTPLEGLVMGTRSGDIDPAIHSFLARNAGMDIEAIDSMLNKDSGLKGLCGMNDMRDIHAAIENGSERARIALEVQTYRNRKYIGAYLAVLGHVDAIVFTAGIGENDAVVREMSLAGLEQFGIALDKDANALRRQGPHLISSADSRVRIWIIPTNEELAIGRESLEVLNNRRHA